jgi:hypothetical protein
VTAATVVYLDPEPSGLASMIGGLIEANLAAHPQRRALLRPALVGLVARDAGVAITLRIAPGRVTVADELAGNPQVVVRADSDTLTELSSIPLRFGFPDPTTPPGRAVTRKLLRGELQVRGLVRHPGVMSRLNRLLSVA